MAETLLKKETLNYKDVENLIGPPPYGKKRLIEPIEFDVDSDEDKPVESTENDDNSNKATKSVSST